MRRRAPREREEQSRLERRRPRRRSASAAPRSRIAASEPGHPGYAAAARPEGFPEASSEAFEAFEGFETPSREDPATTPPPPLKTTLRRASSSWNSGSVFCAPGQCTHSCGSISARSTALGMRLASRPSTSAPHPGSATHASNAGACLANATAHASGAWLASAGRGAGSRTVENGSSFSPAPPSPAVAGRARAPTCATRRRPRISSARRRELLGVHRRAQEPHPALVPVHPPGRRLRGVAARARARGGEARGSANSRATRRDVPGAAASPHARPSAAAARRHSSSDDRPAGGRGTEAIASSADHALA